jgi:hypothetical protein
MVRRQEQCPVCRQASALFWAKHSSGQAVYRCAEPSCGAGFLRPHPKPLLQAIVAPEPVETYRVLRRTGKARVRSVREERAA